MGNRMAKTSGLWRYRWRRSVHVDDARRIVRFVVEHQAIFFFNDLHRKNRYGHTEMPIGRTDVIEIVDFFSTLHLLAAGFGQQARELFGPLVTRLSCQLVPGTLIIRRVYRVAMSDS